MRIAFMGTPDFSVPTLDALAAAGHDIAAVYSQPPRRSGRGKTVQPSPVQRRAEALGIEVRAPVSLRDADEQAAFAALGLDAAVVAAYGLILPQAILDAPRLGCFNVHASLLPRWRGAAPIQRAILAGDAVTGVTIMRMERGLDTGPMLAKVETEIGNKTAGELTGELAGLGAGLMVEVLGDGAPAKAGAQTSSARCTPAFAGERQGEEGVTYAAKIEKDEARLDFLRNADEVERQVRAFNPPGAWFEYAGERIRVLAATASPPAGGRGSRGQPEMDGSFAEDTASPPPTPPASGGGEIIDDTLTIACADGVLRPALVQRAGRAPMPPAALLRGFPMPPGTRLA